MHRGNMIDIDEIINITNGDFENLCQRIFLYQINNNPLYREYVGKRQSAGSLLYIPFLPISFFKTHQVITGSRPQEKIFTSSGTTGTATSRHLVCELGLYERSFSTCFRKFYGNPGDYAILCLLPAYMEREGSSLIYMAEKLVEQSHNPDSGFFLRSEGKLTETLKRREGDGKKSLLLGVSFALLDFAENNPIPLHHTIVMETGGMKGRRTEITRMEMHHILKGAFGLDAIHSEYGMTELLSQAYSKGEGLYHCPPWMRVLVREEDDPFSVKDTGAGILCIIDLANIYSCSFIETADVGRVYEDGSFEVLGRIDNSDIRGCSLLVV
jgi:phenylacetate-coenzyme A ligase PaaK-like adenylate-forming protein